jgi:hypothetical protein
MTRFRREEPSLREKALGLPRPGAYAPGRGFSVHTRSTILIDALLDWKASIQRNA